MGNRDNIDEMSGTNSSVLLSILKLVDKYDLYGQVAYPKHHKQTDVPDIYRLAAKTKVLSCLSCSSWVPLKVVLPNCFYALYLIKNYSLQCY